MEKFDPAANERLYGGEQRPRIGYPIGLLLEPK